MITQEETKRILAHLPFLQGADRGLLWEFQQAARLVTIPAGKDVFVEGDYPDSIALVISGVVRVYKISQTGREITLYRFGLGESCVLTANAILSSKSFPAIATVEKDIEAVIVSAETFRIWVKKFDPWREFIFDLLSDRILILMTIVDEILFQRMDERVARWILQQSKSEKVVETTHQEIAIELGSSREVISRILENLEQDGMIKRGRGSIEIIDMERLRDQASL
jgi:CRP/FNR family transcriptional regulator